MMKTRSRQILPWDQIPWDYEHTPISILGLVRKHGIAWRNTLVRKRDAEGWRRDMQGIVSQLTVAEVASQPSRPQNSGGDDRRHRSQILSAETIRDDVDRSEMLTARQIAGLHASRIRSQLNIAQRVQAAGLAILERITRHLDGDTQDQVELSQHLRRLGGLNPTSETLAGLIKAAAECVEKGVIMERRALGMDAIGGQVPTPETLPPTVIGEGAIALVRRVDAEVGEALRKFAMEAAHTHRQINGHGHVGSGHINGDVEAP